LLYLLRHAQSTANTKGVLAGQDDSVELSKDGMKQADQLVNHLQSLKISKVYCSPLTRCIQTITPFMSENPKVDFVIEPKLIEMDYGAWSGKKLSALARDVKWKKVLNKPSTFLSQLASVKNPVLLVTHGDIIKMFLASALNLPIDRFQSFVAEPASITTIKVDKKSNVVLQTNLRLSKSSFRNFSLNPLGGGNVNRDRKNWWNR
jgi:probable phosphoglycerate mutase